MQVFDCLDAIGAVICRIDPFEEASYSLHLAALKLDVTLCYGSPVLEIMRSRRHGREVGSLSKVELALELMHAGWNAIESYELQPLTPAGPMQFGFNILQRPRLYLVTLVSSSDVFRKGITKIFHCLPEGYYKCLLNLHDLSCLDAIGRDRLLCKFWWALLRRCRIDLVRHLLRISISIKYYHLFASLETVLFVLFL